MKRNKLYQRLLKRMFIIESIGEKVYSSLFLKTKHKNLKLIYQRLAFNENHAARSIAKELSIIAKNNRILVSGIILSFTKLICGLLTARQLAWLLKNILKRRIYRRWYNSYKDKNQELWRLLLDHENLQHELLKPFWLS